MQAELEQMQNHYLHEHVSHDTEYIHRLRLTGPLTVSVKVAGLARSHETLKELFGFVVSTVEVPSKDRSEVTLRQRTIDDQRERARARARLGLKFENDRHRPNGRSRTTDR